MCFAYTTPRSQPTARQLMYVRRIASVGFSSLPLVSTTSGKVVRISLHILGTKNIIDANDKFFHFTLCILPALSVDPWPAEGTVGRLAAFRACGGCREILRGTARKGLLSVCRLWTLVATRRAFYCRYGGTAGKLPAPCRPLEML